MLSIVIPTLQKNLAALYNLLDNLTKDEAVSEIIIIDNSLKGLNYNHPKIRIITPNENLYVNPSWNLGVKEAKGEIVGLLNDDIMIAKDFCSDIIKQMNRSMGLVGMNSGDYIITTNEIKNPKKTDLYLEKTKYMDMSFGVMMFFYKDTYPFIPDKLKIVYGDVWLYYQYKKQQERERERRKENYRISGQIVYHLGSISSGDKVFNPICRQDAKNYKKMTVKWYHRMFSYDETWKGYKIRILGLTLFFVKPNARGVREEN